MAGNHDRWADRRIPPTIHVQAENIGGASTTGAFTLTDELPVGVTLRPEQEILAKWTTGAGAPTSLSLPSNALLAARRSLAKGQPPMKEFRWIFGRARDFRSPFLSKRVDWYPRR